MDPELLKFLSTIFGQPTQPKVGPYKENVPRPPDIPAMEDWQKHPDATRMESFLRNRLSAWKQRASPEDVQNMTLDAITPMGSIKKVGDAALPAAMSHLAKYFKASAKSPFDEYMAEKVALRDKLQAKPPHPLEGVKEAIPIQHSSRALFEHPDPSVFGTGAGDQWQGWGTYLAGNPKVAEYYRGITQKAAEDIPMLHGREANPQMYNIIQAAFSKARGHDNLREMLSKQAHEQATYLKKPSQDMIDIARNDLLRKLKLSERATETSKHLRTPGTKDINSGRMERYQYNEALREYNRLMARANRSSGVVEGQPMGNTYHGYLYANPDELWNMQHAIGNQPASEKLLAGLDQLSTNGNFGSAFQPSMPLGEALHGQMATLGHPSQAYSFAESVLRNGVYDNTPEQIAKALQSKGIVGNRYLNRVTADNIDPQFLGNLPPEVLNNPKHWNYVVTDPSRIDFRDLTALLAAAGLGGAGMQQNKKKEKKKPL